MRCWATRTISMRRTSPPFDAAPPIVHLPRAAASRWCRATRSSATRTAVASARLARVQFWPALKDLSMYSLRIREDGMREPHWHPVTAEMGYVHSGSARMTVMDPDGALDTWYM